MRLVFCAFCMLGNALLIFLIDLHLTLVRWSRLKEGVLLGAGAVFT